MLKGFLTESYYITLILITVSLHTQNAIAHLLQVGDGILAVKKTGGRTRVRPRSIYTNQSWVSMRP